MTPYSNQTEYFIIFIKKFNEEHRRYNFVKCLDDDDDLIISRRLKSEYIEEMKEKCYQDYV